MPNEAVEKPPANLTIEICLFFMLKISTLRESLVCFTLQKTFDEISAPIFFSSRVFLQPERPIKGQTD